MAYDVFTLNTSQYSQILFRLYHEKCTVGDLGICSSCNIPSVSDLDNTAILFPFYCRC